MEYSKVKVKLDEIKLDEKLDGIKVDDSTMT